MTFILLIQELSYVLRKDIAIMCDQVTIEEIDNNQNIMLDVNFTSSA